jgi:4-amino-4-deoxy-L-arabinose transferase-like glycosyltransferase
MRRAKSWTLAAAVAVLWMLVVSRYFPAASAYRTGADEGAYFGQAVTVDDWGLRGFCELARRYVVNRSDLPPPVRIGHILVAALALTVQRSFVALSWLSTLCQAATCLVVFAFSRKVWDERFAGVAGMLLLSSPLANHLASRALADTHAALASVSTLLCFVALILWGESRFLWGFGAALAWSLLVKETSYLLLPFYVLALGWEHWKRPSANRWRVWLVLGVVPLLTLGISTLLFGGLGRFYDVVRVVTTLNAMEPHPYLQAFSSGPWYEYFVDFLLLSPLTALLFFAFCGHFLLGRAPESSSSRATSLLLSFFAFTLLVLAPLPKNPRFVLPLDPLLRIGAASMVLALAERLFKAKVHASIAAIVALAALVWLDWAAFERYFVAAKIYDPVAYNLLEVARMIPAAGH